MKAASCIYAKNKDGLILAVARRGTTDLWGLPGGKVDLGEDTFFCALRETKEETGLELDPEKLFMLYSGQDNNDGFMVFTYFYKDVIEASNLKGDAGPVSFVSEEKLLNGPFGEYNAKVFKTEKYFRSDKDLALLFE